MNLLFVVYAFLLGAVMDIGSMIGSTEARTNAAEYFREDEPQVTAGGVYREPEQFYKDSEPTGDTNTAVGATDAQVATEVGKSAKKSKNSRNTHAPHTRFVSADRTGLFDYHARREWRLSVACHDWERDGCLFGTSRADGGYYCDPKICGEL